MDIETLALAKKYTDEHGGGGGGTTYTAGDGIKIQHNEISVKTKSNGGITVNSDGISADPNTIQTKLTAGNGINISSNTISAKLKSNQGLNADTNGVYVDKNSTLEIDANNKLGVASSIIAQVQASIMHGEASGSVASFIDGGNDMPLKSCIVDIEPVQDLHGYDHPWAGGAGKNKFDKDNANVFNGYIAGGKVTANSNHRCIYIPCKPNTTYTAQKICVVARSDDRFAIGYCNETPANNVDCYNISSITSSSFIVGNKVNLTITTGAEAKYIIIWVSTTTYYSQSIATTQIEQGSQATTYEPYSNICPISGWTECNLVDDSVNQWDEDWEVGTINDSGVPTPSSTAIRGKNFIVVKPSTSYYFVGTGALYVCQYDANKTFIRKDNLPNFARQMTANTYYVKVCTGGSYGNTYNNDISINYPSTDTSYHAFTGQTYNIQFPSQAGTVYGGTLDVTNGVLTVTDGYIASYNGETLPSTWISSMDVYAEGTTPTTGAEVVYKLATPQTYNLTPTEIKTLLGINNIFADCGDIENLYYYTQNARDIADAVISLISNNE